MWEKEYKKKKFYWGLKPNPVLAKFLPHIPKGKALDIGAGEGRNSIFLAENGFKVTAIDLVPEGLKKLVSFAKRYHLKISTKVIDVRRFKFFPDKYSLILSVATLDFLKKSEIDIIIKKIKKSLVFGGAIYLLVFSTKDPLYYKIKRWGLKPTEKNTFFLSKGKIYRHFFTVNEIRKMFKRFHILHLEQKGIKDTSHNQPHCHNIIEFVAQKKKAVS